MAHQNKRVAVVGVGIAGAACAHHLAHAGCTVTLFDKARGASGRMSTRRTDMAHYDHGAQYFTAKSNVFTAQVNDWLKRGVVALWQPRVTNPDLQQWFVGIPDMPTVVKDLVKNIDLHVSTRIESLERMQYSESVHQPKPALDEALSNAAIPANSAALANAFTWQLTTDKGEVFANFTDVVIAVPPVQAVPLVQPIASNMAGLLNSIDMLPCWTVMLSTTDAVTTALPIDAERVVDHPTLAWWARNDTKPGRVQHAGQADWVLQATADWTLAHLNTDPAEVVRQLCDAFWRHVGVQTLPKVQQSMAHRWLYSHRTLEPLSTTQSLWAANIRLGICGDGLIHSRVESAYLSGVHMAETLLGKY